MDWIGSTNRYGLDGSITPGNVLYGYRFDSVTQSPDCRYVVLYEKRGTKAIVLKDGRLLREINRSFYFAEAYDYPITLFDLPDGRPVIAHCPHRHNRLEIELLETGECLTQSAAREFDDIFYSGLATSPSGKMLMSAGWVWHPAYVVSLFKVSEALLDPTLLDAIDAALPIQVEVASAAFLDDDRIVIAINPDAQDLSDLNDGNADAVHGLGMLALYRISTKQLESCVPFSGAAGILHIVDAEHILALYQHPKLVHWPTGKVVERWPEIPTGTWAGCIDVNAHHQPPHAWDATNKRLAVGTPTQIHVLSFTA